VAVHTGVRFARHNNFMIGRHSVSPHVLLFEGFKPKLECIEVDGEVNVSRAVLAP
jgi:hypothetical protein